LRAVRESMEKNDRVLHLLSMSPENGVALGIDRRVVAVPEFREPLERVGISDRGVTCARCVKRTHVAEHDPQRDKEEIEGEEPAIARPHHALAPAVARESNHVLSTVAPRISAPPRMDQGPGRSPWSHHAQTG